MMLKEIVCAVEKAGRDYEKMSGDCLRYGTECYLAVSIAKRMKKKRLAKWVTLETPVDSDFIRYRQGRRNKAMRPTGRVDIALWNDEPEDVTDVVEVKLSTPYKACEADFTRLALIAKRSWSVRGWFAYYRSDQKRTSKEIRTYLSKVASELEIRAKDIAGRHGVRIETSYKITKPEEYEGEFYAALCMSIGFKPDHVT